MAKAFVVDADFGPVNQGADRAKEKMDSVAKAAGKAGDKISLWERGLNSTVTKLAGIAAAINAVTTAVSEKASRESSANRTAGEKGLGRDTAAGRLGLNPEHVSALINEGSGAASADDLDAFLSSAADRSSKARVPFKRNDTMRALNLRASGLYEDDELFSIMEKGGRLPGPIDVEKRRSKLSDASREELRVREFERANANFVRRQEAPRGAARREAESQFEAQRALNPTEYMVEGALNAVTFGATREHTLSQIEAGFAKQREMDAMFEQNRLLREIGLTNAQMAAPRLIVPIDPANPNNR